MIRVTNGIPRNDVQLGIVSAERIEVNARPAGFEERLMGLLEARRIPLAPEEEQVRSCVRDMLRNGRYKPTGRGKPASEYLLRTTGEEESSFPRINFPVDVCNYFSLKYLLPISLWDVDLTGTKRFLFRLGKEGESYVFNSAGQVIELTDLVVGCRVIGESEGEPIVNPVKDSQLTKTNPSTHRVAAAVYAPAGAVTPAGLEDICKEFSDMLALAGESGTPAVAAPGMAVDL